MSRIISLFISKEYTDIYKKILDEEILKAITSEVKEVTPIENDLENSTKTVL